MCSQLLGSYSDPSWAPGAEVWPEPCDHLGGEQAGQAGDPELLNSMDFGNSCGEKDEKTPVKTGAVAHF